MEHTIGTIRVFKTRNFQVIVDALEDYDMDLSFDEDGETRKGLESGKYIGFCARARVILNATGEELASDYLGGCIYESLEAFMDHRACGRETARLRATGSKAICGSYFSDMIHEVCTGARKEWATRKKAVASIRIREAKTA